MASKEDVIDADGQNHLITAPFQVRGWSIINGSQAPVMVRDGGTNPLATIGPLSIQSGRLNQQYYIVQPLFTAPGQVRIISFDNPRDATTYQAAQTLIGKPFSTTFTDATSTGISPYSVVDQFAYNPASGYQLIQVNGTTTMRNGSGGTFTAVNFKVQPGYGLASALTLLPNVYTTQFDNPVGNVNLVWQLNVVCPIVQFGSTQHFGLAFTWDTHGGSEVYDGGTYTFNVLQSF